MNIENIKLAIELYSELTTIEDFEGTFADYPELPICTFGLANTESYIIPECLRSHVGELFKKLISERKETILKQIEEL